MDIGLSKFWACLNIDFPTLLCIQSFPLIRTVTIFGTPGNYRSKQICFTNVVLIRYLEARGQKDFKYHIKCRPYLPPKTSSNPNMGTDPT